MGASSEGLAAKLIGLDRALSIIKTGRRIGLPISRIPATLCWALGQCMGELAGAQVQVVRVPATTYKHFGWFQPGAEGVNVVVDRPPHDAPELMGERGWDRNFCFCLGLREIVAQTGFLGHDVFLVELGPPDEKGWCTIGPNRWYTKEQIEGAGTVIAELNPALETFCGDSRVQLSHVDYFVEPGPFQTAPAMRELFLRNGPPSHAPAIAHYVNSLLKDGDTVQIGSGSTTEWLVKLGALDGKTDLGFHSEITPLGVIDLVVKGIITGKHKSLDVGKAVAASLDSTAEERALAQDNPRFELRSMLYTDDIRVVIQQKNMVAINSAVLVDLTGQISAESSGLQLLGTPGGQPAFAIGAVLAEGGRSIHVLPSTAQQGKVSRITALLPEGTAVTVPHTFADIVVTEYGVAHLRGKTEWERARELIAVAHPDFRPQLRKEAQRVLGLP